MSKDFSVYKWRREHLATEPINEALSDDPMVKAIYNEIEKFLDPKEIRVGKSFIEMAIMRGIMTGERNKQPSVNENIEFDIKKKEGKTPDGKEYIGYYRSYSRREGDEIVKDIKKKGFEFVDVVDYEDPDRKTEYRYYFKRPSRPTKPLSK